MKKTNKYPRTQANPEYVQAMRKYPPNPTLANQTMTPREIAERFVATGSVPKYADAYYDPQELTHDNFIPDPRSMDPTELQQHLDTLKENISDTEEKIKNDIADYRYRNEKAKQEADLINMMTKRNT